MLSEDFQIQEFYCQISFHTRSIPGRAILQPDIRKRACAYVHVSVCHTPSLTVARASLWWTRFIIERKASSKNMPNQGKSKPMTHRPHRGSAVLLHGDSAGTSLICPSTLPTFIFWTAPFLGCESRQSEGKVLPYLHMHCDNKGASSKSPVTVIRECCHTTVGIWVPLGIYPSALLKAKLCSIGEGDACKMLL